MSYKVCCVSGCTHRGKGLHKFPNPIRDPDRFQKWKLFSGVDRNDRGGMTDTAIANGRRICRSHFPVQFHYPKNKLCRLAVPTLLPGNHPTETQKTDSASNSHSLDSPTLPKSSNASPIDEIAANKPTESLPEKISDTQVKLPRDILIQDPVTDKSVDAVEHRPLMTEDQGDISTYHDDDALRPVEKARNDLNDPVDESVDAAVHGPPVTEDQGDISMYHDDPLRPMAEARNDSITLGVPVHRFPHPDKDPDLFDTWVSVIGDKLKETDRKKIYNNKRICHHHFDPRDKMETGSHLKRSSIPSLHLNGVRQSLATFMVTDHSYCSRRRGFLSGSMTDITNLPGPSRPMMDITKPGSSRLADELTEIPVPSGSTSTTCVTVPEKACARTSQTNFDADDPVDKSVDAVEHGPPISEDQGDLMYHGDDPLRLVAENGNDSNDPVDKSVDAEDQGDISMYHDDDPLRLVAEGGNDSTIEDEQTDGPPDGTDECYFCNVCKESIKGFRYTCVQCEDWDLCGACEARAAHAKHYVLRIPSPRPYKEIQAVLTAVRQQLINQKILPGKADSVKEEPNSGAEDATEPDTLDWDDDFYEKDNICIELEDGEHPPRKRLRPEASSTHSNQDLTTPESPKPTHDHITDVLFNHDVTKSSKDIQPRTLPNDNPSIPKPGLRLTETTPQTTGTLLPTRALNNKRTLTIKPISRLPLGARVIKLSACFGKSAICIKEAGDHPPPRKLLHQRPSSIHSDHLTTPKSPKATRDRTTHVHFNHDVTNSAKNILPGMLPNDTPTNPKPGLNRLIGTMPQTTGTLLPTRALSNSRTMLTLKPITGLPSDLRVVKKTVIVGNSARLSEEKTKKLSSSQRPEHATAVSPPTTTITTLERGAMSDPKANSKWCQLIMKGSSPADIVIAPKSKVLVRLKPIDDSKMEKD